MESLTDEEKAKLDRFFDLTKRLLLWLQEQGIDYSHIVKEYDEEHKRQNGRNGFSTKLLFLWYNVGGE